MAEVFHPNDIRGLRFVEQASFDAGDPGSGYAALRAYEIGMELGITTIERASQKPIGNRGMDTSVRGGKLGSLSFKLQLRPGSGVEPEWYKIAKNCGFSEVNGSAVSTTVTSATNDQFDAASVSGMDEDMGLLISDGSNFALRFVESISGNTVEVSHDWKTGYTPSNGDTVTGLRTLVPPQDPGEPSSYLTFQVFVGAGADQTLYTLTGCAGTMNIETIGVESVPMVTFEFMIDSWVITTPGSQVTWSADTQQTPYPVLGSDLWVNDTELKTEEIAFNPGQNMVPVTAFETNGRCGWRYLNSNPAPEIKPYADSAWYERLVNGVTFRLNFECIKDADEAWGLSVPAAEVVAVADEARSNDLQGNTPELVARDPGFTGSHPKALWRIAVS